MQSYIIFSKLKNYRYYFGEKSTIYKQNRILLTYPSVCLWLAPSFALHVSRVMTHYLFAQRGHVHVRIYLRSGYVFVSEHLLDGSQAGSSLQQGCGERMAQGVWRDRLLDACVACRVLYHYQYHGAREVCSAAVEEHILLFTGLDVHDVTVVHPFFYFLQGVVRYGDEAFLATFTDDAQTMFLLEDVGEAQRHEFADAQSA